MSFFEGKLLNKSLTMKIVKNFLFLGNTFVSETPRDIFPDNTGHLHQQFSGIKSGVEIPFRSGSEKIERIFCRQRKKLDLS
jgi:hypothetical protein